MKTKPYFAILLLAFISAAANAQQTTVEKKGLTLEGAKRAIAAAVVEAKKGAGTAAIAVVDEGGNLIAVERLDNTFTAGANISIGKARTAVSFKKPTKFFEDLINKGRTAMTALNDFTPLQGGVPIIVEGQVVGGIGVSGAASAQQDEEVAIAGANALASSAQSMSTSQLPVTYVAKEQVAAAFNKGAPLVDTTGRNCRVDASRRTDPGQAEIHTKDTDVIYVLAGEATFITGGNAVDLKQTAQDEFRGARIDGGETHKLAAGDVIVVPAGTPHWFSQIKGEFHYYVVKVS